MAPLGDEKIIPRFFSPVQSRGDGRAGVWLWVFIWWTQRPGAVLGALRASRRPQWTPSSVKSPHCSRATTTAAASSSAAVVSAADPIPLLQLDRDPPQEDPRRCPTTLHDFQPRQSTTIFQKCGTDFIHHPNPLNKRIQILPMSPRGGRAFANFKGTHCPRRVSRKRETTSPSSRGAPPSSSHSANILVFRRPNPRRRPKTHSVQVPLPATKKNHSHLFFALVVFVPVLQGCP